MKMLDSAAFYTPSGNSPAVFLVYFWHSCYIPSTFEMHSRYSSCILSEFLDARTAFGSHSVSTLTAFEQQSRHLPCRRYSGSNRTAFDLHSEHFDSILNIPTEFQLNSSCIWELIHSECARIIRCGFEAVLSIRTAFLQKMTIPPECNWNFENVSFRLIPADSGSFRFRVTGALRWTEYWPIQAWDMHGSPSRVGNDEGIAPTSWYKATLRIRTSWKWNSQLQQTDRYIEKPQICLLIAIELSSRTRPIQHMALR